MMSYDDGLLSGMWWPLSSLGLTQGSGEVYVGPAPLGGQQVLQKFTQMESLHTDSHKTGQRGASALKAADCEERAKPNTYSQTLFGVCALCDAIDATASKIF